MKRLVDAGDKRKCKEVDYIRKISLEDMFQNIPQYSSLIFFSY